ncbi:hypothetical protein Tco_0900899 [Tanacetum coccineum]
MIAPGMFKLELEPLSPKLKKNREAHVNYLKTIKDNADTLLSHDQCVIDYLNDVNAHARAKSVKRIKKKEWKPTGKVFKNYFNPSPSVISPVLLAAAPLPTDTTSTPSSTTIDQDAPSVSILQTIQENEAPVIHQGVEEKIQGN